jgi:hypothetical protein
MNEGTMSEVFDGIRVLAVNTGVLGVVTFGELEGILNITLLTLTCIWTIIKIKKLLKK